MSLDEQEVSKCTLCKAEYRAVALVDGACIDCVPRQHANGTFRPVNGKERVSRWPAIVEQIDAALLDATLPNRVPMNLDLLPPIDATTGVPAETTTTREQVLSFVLLTLDRAERKHGHRFASTWEALGVMTEEYDEYLDAVRSNDTGENMQTELAQIAAVAIKALGSIFNPRHHAAGSDGMELGRASLVLQQDATFWRERYEGTLERCRELLERALKAEQRIAESDARTRAWTEVLYEQAHLATEDVAKMIGGSSTMADHRGSPNGQGGPVRPSSDDEPPNPPADLTKASNGHAEAVPEIIPWDAPTPLLLLYVRSWTLDFLRERLNQEPSRSFTLSQVWTGIEPLVMRARHERIVYSMVELVIDELVSDGHVNEREEYSHAEQCLVGRYKAASTW